MKNLGQFFDFGKFVTGKKLVVTDNQILVDYDTKAPLGRTIEVGIMEDNTEYLPSNTGKPASTNLLEKFKVKVLDDKKGNMDAVSRITNGTEVTFQDFKKTGVYINTQGKNPTLALTIECYKCVPVNREKK